MKAGFSLFSFTVFILHASVFAMDSELVIDMGENNSEVLYEAHHYVQAAQDSQYDALQKELDVLVNYGTDISAAKKVFESLYDYAINECRTKHSDNVVREFAAIQHESYLKMAYRFAFAKELKYDIDELKCCEFLNKAEQFCVNIFYNHHDLKKIFQQHYNPTVLSGEYLEYSIPFLELVFEKPVTILNLDGAYIIKFPKSITVLNQLEILDIVDGKTWWSAMTCGSKTSATLIGQVIWNKNFSLLATEIPQWLLNLPSLKVLNASIFHIPPQQKPATLKFTRFGGE